MDPDFKDLLPWQEMSKRVKELQETQAIIKAYFAEGPSKQLYDLKKRIELLESRTNGNTAPTESLAATRQTMQDI